MNTRALMVGVGIGVSVCGGIAAAWQPAKEPAVAPAGRVNDATQDAVKALAFLEGTWRGTMEGDPVEEIWSAPAGDSIMGCFRWHTEGKTTMWEMLSIRAEDGAAVLRLRHFNGNFEPWKGECEGVAAMKATTVEKSRVVFTNAGGTGGLASCEYHRTAPETLAIVVSFKPETQREPLKFSLTRAK